MKLRPLLLTLLVLPVIQGCKPMLYPVARAFGGPSEGELQLRRAAFERLKAARSTARVLVHPAFRPAAANREAYPATAHLAAELLQGYGWTHCQAVRTPPPLPATPLMRNQLRYVQTRARAYSDWAKTSRPDADFLVILEVLVRPEGGIVGIHCYVLEATGQVAYARQFNSHHFGAQSIDLPANAVGFALRALSLDIQRPADQVHPPYGVG
jgi:hypothetical protein